MIERLIITGLINSTEYLQQVRPVWDSQMIGSRSAAQVAEWCIEFYDEYSKAPERDIDTIYYSKKKAGEIPRDMVEEIEEDLEDLALEFDEPFNLQYALDQTERYFLERALELHQNEIDSLIEQGDIKEAEALAHNFSPPTFKLVNDLDLSKKESEEKIRNAFAETGEVLIRFPGALGDMLNDSMVRGGFVSLMASEKRGKSFWLLEMALRGSRQYKVAFFQAGDMTEGQQIKRLASYLAKLPTNERYTGQIYVPVPDCVRNQLDTCEKPERLGDEDAFSGNPKYDEETFRKNIIRDDLIEAYEDLGEYHKPCTNCEEHGLYRLGTPWLVPEDVPRVVDEEDAVRVARKYFQKTNRRFKISTHANDTLTVTQIKNILGQWERLDGFVPDIIIIDYADLLVPEKTQEFRHGQNEIWKNLRALSQLRNCLVLTATQAGAKSYERDLLRVQDFSEDKRKYAHVTAMFGLNQDKFSREKKLGLMRLNQMVIREGEFDVTSTVTVLQNLNLGRPFLDSYR